MDTCIQSMQILEVELHQLHVFNQTTINTSRNHLYCRTARTPPTTRPSTVQLTSGRLARLAAVDQRLLDQESRPAGFYVRSLAGGAVISDWINLVLNIW